MVHNLKVLELVAGKTYALELQEPISAEALETLRRELGIITSERGVRFIVLDSRIKMVRRAPMALWCRLVHALGM